MKQYPGGSYNVNAYRARAVLKRVPALADKSRRDCDLSNTMQGLQISRKGRADE